MTHARMPHPIRRRLAVAATVVLSLGFTASPASATGVHDQAGPYVEPPTPYHNVGEFDPECADVDVSVAYDYKGVSSVRRVRGTDGQAFFAKDRFRFSEVWSEASTGEVLFTQRGRYRFEEVKAKRVRKADVPADAVPPEGLVGPVYRFISVEKGHDTVRDGDGRRLYRTAGVVVFSSLFDTLGDHAPGGTELTFDPVKVFGPHPLLDVDLCDLAVEQAG
jgi:hypothetical protein